MLGVTGVESRTKGEIMRRLPSWKERRRRAGDFLERLDTFQANDDDVETLDTPKDERGHWLEDGPKSAPVHASPPAQPHELRRTRSLEYHPFSSPIMFSALGRECDDEDLDFEYLLSPIEQCERGSYELPALSFGPKLDACLQADWEQMVLEAEAESFEPGLGALVAADSRGEWRKHPFAC